MHFQTPLEEILRLTPQKKSALKKLGLLTVRDLLLYAPVRHEKFAMLKKISDLAIGENASVIGDIVRIDAQKTWRKKMNLAEAILHDDTGFVKIIWFGQPYIANIIRVGTRIRCSGRVQYDKKNIYFSNPIWEIAQPITHNQQLITAGLLPVYSETYALSSQWLRYHIRKILDEMLEWQDAIPEPILKKYHLPLLKRALWSLHFPKKPIECEIAKKRFSFEEIFLIQLDRQLERRLQKEIKANAIAPDLALMKQFAESLPFKLTNAQRRVIWQILKDIKKPNPMARLLEGDVGSGKTIVAAAIALQAANRNLQTAFMAPTEILAHQHFQEFIKRLGSFKSRIGLLTSSESQKFPSKISYKKTVTLSKSALLKQIASGEIQMLIGTHSLIQDKVRFKSLGLAVIDEQHRFGTKQRQRLAKEKKEIARHNDSLKIFKQSQIGFAKAAPHLLSMTATPIPRTLALTIYGNLDLSVLDEMPPGRKKIITAIVPPRDRNKTYEFIREELERGRQAFVICPRIEKPINKQYKTAQAAAAFSEMKAVKEEYKKLSQEIFPEFKIAMLHGKLKPKEKEETMQRFKKGETHILVSTSVVEVGVDVPNATIMMIEGGERYGLAQLHQFRGRVGRGEHQSHCFVFTQNDSERVRERLKALESAKNGFELAEYDLQFRGAGELSGSRQWGISDVGMEALKNIRMVEAARTEAHDIVTSDPQLKKYPLLRERLADISQKIHFE